MRIHAAAIPLLLLLASCSNDSPSAAPSSAVMDARLPQAEASRIQAHIEFLADDLLQGRDTGSEGHAIAANYVASQFAQIGVQPAGDNQGYFQNIVFRQAYRDESAAELIVHTGQGDAPFVFAEDFVNGSSLSNTDSTVTAPLVFVGYGIEADWLNHHDYAGLDVDGKIVVALSGKPDSFPSEEGAHFSSGDEKRNNAVSRGAVGYITLRTPLAESTFPFERGLATLHMPAVGYLDPDGTPAGSSPQLKGSVGLSLEASRRLFELAGRSLDDMFAMIDAGEAPQGFALPLEATLSQKSRHQTITSPNVVGMIEGSDPQLKNEYVMFTAHLDHVGRASGDGEDTILNGALDNAAGVSALLENARLLMSLPERPRRSILFVIVTAEEKGLLGAQYYSNNPTVPMRNIVANVNLDMPMLLYPFTNVIAFGAQHSSLKGSTENALKALDLELMDDPMPEENLFVRSDHYMFVKKGVPAVFLSVGFGSSDPDLNGEEIFNNFLQTHYHQVSDSIDLPINYEAGALFAQVNFMIGTEVANADERPTWNENDFFGTEFGNAE
jgi:hypothetical protein